MPSVVKGLITSFYYVKQVYMQSQVLSPSFIYMTLIVTYNNYDQHVH